MKSPSIPIASILLTLFLIAAASRSSMPSEYRCNGNEPFWGLAIDGEHAGWATPQDPEGQSLEGTYRLLDYVGLFAWRGDFGGGDLVAIISDQTCSDTMSDRDYPFQVSVSLPDGRLVLGCCDSRSRPAAESGTEPIETRPDEPDPEDLDERLAALPIAVLDEKPPGDWSRFLFDLLPAIRACVEETPGSSPRVSKAWTRNPQRVGVRLSSTEGAGFECVATRQGSEVESLTALTGPAFDHRSGWSPVFTLPEQPPPAGECYQHERVVDADGALVGWLSYDTC